MALPEIEEHTTDPQRAVDETPTSRATRYGEPELLHGPTYVGIPPDQFNAMQAVIAAAREYHHLCQMWDNAMDARDPGALDLLDDEIPAARQRLWDTLAALTTDGAS